MANELQIKGIQNFLGVDLPVIEGGLVKIKGLY